MRKPHDSILRRPVTKSTKNSPISLLSVGTPSLVPFKPALFFRSDFLKVALCFMGLTGVEVVFRTFRRVVSCFGGTVSFVNVEFLPPGPPKNSVSLNALYKSVIFQMTANSQQAKVHCKFFENHFGHCILLRTTYKHYSCFWYENVLSKT